MNDTFEFLSKLQQRDIKLSVEGEKLFVDAPAGTLTPDLRREISERKQLLLGLLGQTAALPALVPAPDQRHQPFPLTDIQQAYWLGRDVALELGNVSAHFYLELEGQGLDLERLNWAWQRLIERHDMLRTIILPDGQQQVLPQVPAYRIEVLDLRDQAESQTAAQIEMVRQELSHQVLKTEQWPLFEIRATLLDRERIRLHLSLDLLIADVSSNFILAREWAELYYEPVHSLPPLELTFRDYVLAEQKLREEELVRRSETYWFNRLDSLPPGPELPLAYNPGSLSQPHFVRRSAHLSATTWQQLKQLASQAGLTPSGVLLAAFAEILTTWSKSPRFTLNLTLFNRLPLHPQINNIVGDFTSLTLLEVDNSSSEPFSTRAHHLQQQLWQDMDHRYISGVRVIRELARRQGGQRVMMPVVFTSTLALGPADQSVDGLSQLGEEVYGISQTPQVWLDHQAREQKGALLFNWDAVEDLFPAGLLDDMFEAYCGLLKRLAHSEAAWTEPSRLLLPAAQLAQRAEVNNTTAPITDDLLHTLFITQAAARPAHPAIIAPDRCLTYQELLNLASQLGFHLREAGTQPNTLVAVVMEKGWEQIVAVLGILISGAAYLPIDPDLPAERRRYLLDQGQVNLALTQSWLNNTLDWPETVQRIVVDTLPPASSPRPLTPGQTSTDLAYIIYTSGSTGQPKGVMIDHRGAVNTLLDLNDRFDVTSADRVLALSALSFDLSVFDIFGPLAAGGTIIMPQAQLAKDPAHWADLCRHHHVTLWNSVPALMQMLVDYLNGRVERLSSLRLVMLSGDWIPVSLPDLIKQLWPQVQLYSLGGATEASIWSIFYPIDRVQPTWTSIPYGRPLRNQSFHVLNHLLDPCPTWVPGELYIGGIGLAKGYWQDEVKTNERFITHPQTGERLYKTGDLGRYLPDSNIEFLGREDFQVKIRGYRIELGEIEAALQQHPAVSEAVVTAVGPSRHHQHLVAYVVPNSSTPSDQIGEAYTPQSLAGIILDPVERLEFKLKQPGLEPVKLNQSEVQLPLPTFDETLTQAYLTRQSYRRFRPDPLPLEQFSQFLSCLLQLSLPGSPLPKYRYPSAGNLYPVQTYLYIKPERVEGLAGGFYYYHPAHHRLILRHATNDLEGHLYGLNHSIFEPAAFSLFLIGQLNAIAPLYGELARDFCLLEAGYIGQLLMSAAPVYEIGLCPIGHVDVEALREPLGLEAGHILVHSFVGGGIDPAQTQQWLIPAITPKTEPITEQLRHYLQTKLPDYMVPATCILLESLPLTVNGKIDRKALPAPDLRASTFEPPRTPTEASVAALWADILDREQVGREEDFFASGGDSLLAIQLISRLRETFQVNLPLRCLFETPTIAGLAEQIEASLQEQATSLRKPVKSLPQIVPDPSQRHQPFPLTDIQQAYWLGRSSAFELSQVATHGYLELEGQNLNLERLTLAWQRLIERHDMLRAIILPDGRQQILAQVPPYQIKPLNLRGQSEDAVTTQLETIRQELSHQVLPAEQWPLFEIRATLLGGDRTRLHLSFDMLLADGWSLLTLAHEWVRVYQEPDLALPCLELAFRDYVVAEQSLQETELVRQSETYWFNRLDSLPPGPELPLAHNPSSLSQPHFVRRGAHLSATTWQQLKQRASQNGLTPSGVLLAAFAEILTIWSKSSRFTLNLTLFNRLPLHPQVNDIIGDFTSLTLLEVDNSSSESLSTRAHRLQQQLWQDMDHRHVSGVRVLRELARRQGGQRVAMPIVFTSLLALDISEQGLSLLHQLGKEVYGISQTPQVWLDHQVREEKGALLFNWDAVEDLFPAGLLDDMFTAYCHLLERLATSEAAWTESSRPLLSPVQLTQRTQVNDTAAPVTDDLLHTLFITQAAARPAHPAIIAPDRCLTYQELLDLSSQLGYRLREAGAQPNTLIAVVMEKGWEQVAAVLGILISGAAYLPIDPDLPPERRRYLLDQGQVNLALTQSWLNNTLDWPETIQRIVVDTLPPTPGPQPPTPLQKNTDLAYVIYTSGSTGQPKGVMIDHRGAVNTLLDLIDRFEVTSDDRVLALSALSFDLSVFDIFGTLAAGGTIIIPQAYLAKDPAHWTDLCRQHHITLWNSVPALMQMLVDHLNGQMPPASLRLVMLSGDWIPVTLPDLIKQFWPQAQLYSLGGATEASIWSIFYPIDQVQPTWTSIPYGKPLRNQSFHVLNTRLDPCPIWVPGELYIGGIGLAKGYWQDEVKTNERFITHPQTGERLYKTGDLGRYLPDSNIEFLGREDFQVKIRGYRIELGEIEAALQQHPAVSEAVVTAVGPSRHHQHLVAYVVPEAAASFEPEGSALVSAQNRWDILVKQGIRQAQQPAWEIDLESFSTLWQDLDLLYLKATGQALLKLNIFQILGEAYDLEQVMSRSQIAPRYRKWITRALQSLAEKGWLRQDGQRFESTAALLALTGEELAVKFSAEQVQQLGLSGDELNVPLEIAKKLPEVLTEQIHSAEIYAAAETSLLYQKMFPYGNAIAREVIAGLVQSLPPGESLRILEVGAGLGSTTLHVLPLLPSKQTTYFFTDISSYFFQAARKNFAAYPFVEYHLFDLEQDPQRQGYELHSFDVIIASSVLHVPRRVEESLQHVHSLLASAGVLLMIEETRFHPLYDLSMGLQQGFDQFEDEVLRPHHPLLSREQWQDLMAQVGFEKSVVLHQPGSVADWLGLDVLLAQGSAAAPGLKPEVLRRYLHQKLPEYMVPAAFILLDALPLTANGKVDRQSLPAPNSAGPDLTRSFVAPRTELEVQLVEVWADILDLEGVGIHDNFFEIGGDSLLATQLISQVREKLALELPLRSLFEAPTVAGLARHIEALRLAVTELQVVADLSPNNREEGRL